MCNYAEIKREFEKDMVILSDEVLAVDRVDVLPEVFVISHATGQSVLPSLRPSATAKRNTRSFHLRIIMPEGVSKSSHLLSVCQDVPTLH